MTTAATTTRRRTDGLLTRVDTLDPVTVAEAAAVLADALQPLTNRQILDEVCYARGIAAARGAVGYGDPWPLSKITGALDALVADGRAVVHQGAPNPVYGRLDGEQILGVYGSSPATRWYTRPDLDAAMRARRHEQTRRVAALDAEAAAVVAALDGLTGTVIDAVQTGPYTGQIQIRLTAPQARALFPDRFGETS